MKRLLLAAACLLAFVFLANTAGAATCVPGHSYMGCNTAPPKVGLVRAPAGAEYPDVSFYQGAVDWSQVKAWQVAHHWTPAGIFKLGEGGYGIDSYAGANAAALHRLGMTAVGYWFVRPIGCYPEAQQIVSEAQALHITTVVEDVEVPGTAGYAPCLATFLRQDGLTPVVYTSAGAWPGGASGGLPLWDATYGPSMILSGLWTLRPVAWQFSPSAFVPGIHGSSDISVDRGLLALANPPAPPKPSPAEEYQNYPDQAWVLDGQTVRERSTVETWDLNKCENPVVREVCVTTRQHLVLLQGRLIALASQFGWGYGSPVAIGLRNQEIYHRLVATKPILTWEAGL